MFRLSYFFHCCQVDFTDRLLTSMDFQVLVFISLKMQFYSFTVLFFNSRLLSVFWCGPNKNVQSTLYNESTEDHNYLTLPCESIKRIRKRLKPALLRSAGALLKQKAAEIGACSVHSAPQLPYNVYLIYMQIKAIKTKLWRLFSRVAATTQNFRQR